MTEVPEDLTHRRVAVGEFWSVRGAVNSVGISVMASRPTSDEAGRGV